MQKGWNHLQPGAPAPERKLPVILSPAEVRQLLSHLRLRRYRVCLATIYSCGPLLQECTILHVAGIPSTRAGPIACNEDLACGSQ